MVLEIKIEESSQYTPQPTSQPTPTKPQSVEILAQIPDPKTVQFDAMDIPKHLPRTYLPADIDIDDPVALFKLLLPDTLWESVVYHTNLYAETCRSRMSSLERTRPWHTVSFNDIMVFIGSIIYMGYHPEHRLPMYWQQNRLNGPLHTIPLYISLMRFEQIKRYLHISKPTDIYGGMTDPYHIELDIDNEWKYDAEHIGKICWNKLEPMISVFRSKIRQYYMPSSELSIDELMIKCYGRSNHTFSMPHKPIPRGYKLFALADHGYIYAFTPASRTKSLVEVIKQKDLLLTGSMVV